MGIYPKWYYINYSGDSIICRRCNKVFDISADDLDEERLLREIEQDAFKHIAEGMRPFFAQMEKEGWQRKTITIEGGE